MYRVVSSFGLMFLMFAVALGCSDDTGSATGGSDSGTSSSGGDGDGDGDGDSKMDGGSNSSSGDGDGDGDSKEDAGRPMVVKCESDEDGGCGDPCGAVVCEPSECCADPFQSLCGRQQGRSCLQPPPDIESDMRCPPLDLGSLDPDPMADEFVVPSCCTDSGDCGLDTTVFGFPGCIELDMFDTIADQMSGMDLPTPPAQKCDP